MFASIDPDDRFDYIDNINENLEELTEPYYLHVYPNPIMFQSNKETESKKSDNKTDKDPEWLDHVERL